MRKVTTFCLVSLLLFVLIGCKTGKQVQVPEGYVGKGDIVLGVPHIQQNNGYECATNSLGMVMAYFDKDMGLEKYDKAEIWNRSGASVGTTRQWGNSMAALARAAESYGFTDNRYLSADIETVHYLIDNGIPVIANVRAKGSRGEYSHAVVIDGYNATELHIDDPVKGAFWEEKETFQRRWWANLSQPRGKQSRTLFVVMPKGKNLFATQ